MLLERLSSQSSNSTIITYGKRGGLGHKTVSIIGHITYALLLNRNYKCMVFIMIMSRVWLNEWLWSNTNTCFAALRYNGMNNNEGITDRLYSSEAL